MQFTIYILKKLHKCVINIKPFVLKVEAEARFEGHGGASMITCIFVFFIRMEKQIRLNFSS